MSQQFLRLFFRIIVSSAPLAAVVGYCTSTISSSPQSSSSSLLLANRLSTTLTRNFRSSAGGAIGPKEGSGTTGFVSASSSSTRRYMSSGGRNPLDMISSLFSSQSSSSQQYGGITLDNVRSVNTALDTLSSSSRNALVLDWNSIRSSLTSKMIHDDERNFRDNLSKGYGVASPLHTIRLFDESNDESKIRVVFYRDSASWCPYCQKVWLTLEEKRIPYRVEKINMRCYGEKPDSFKRLQPGGQIPVAIIDGTTTLRQSNDILLALEEMFPNHKSMLTPKNDPLRGFAQELLQLERQLFSAWMNWLTVGGGDRSKQSFLASLAKVEQALTYVKNGPFFLGKDITMVDVQFVPFLERMAASLLYYKGFQIRVVPGTQTDYPSINAWFDAMETLPSYQVTKSDYYTHCWDLPPQLGGCLSEPGGKRYEDVINGVSRIEDGGKSQGSWELPLQPHNGGVEPDWDWAGDEGTAKREAVERISANAQAVIKFAARGAGSKGFPSYGAALSDPNAVPNEAVIPAVDVILRLVCLALLDGTEAHENGLSQIADTLVAQGGNDFTRAIIASLSYMRDRVGVPRDMKLPAARQLRSHLNWAISALLKRIEA